MALLGVVAKMISMRGVERLDRRQIEALRERRFRNLLRHVLERSRFYSDYYRRHGVTAEHIDEIAPTDLPTLNKRTVMENFDELVCDGAIRRQDVERFVADPVTGGKRYRGKYTVVRTSGTTGKAGIFVYGPGEWDLVRALFAQRVLRISRISRIGRRLKAAFILATEPHLAGTTLCRDGPRFLFEILPVSIDSPIDEIVRQINRFQPDLMGGYCSGVHLLAQLQLDGRINIKPKRVVCSGELLTTNIRQIVAAAFGVQPVDFYAASESMALGASCDECGNLHLFDDWHLFEAVDDRGKPAAPGSVGGLVVTSLYNYTQPLIRYRIDDDLTLDNNVCPCGRPFALVREFAGRSGHVLQFTRPDGAAEYVHHSAIWRLSVPGLRQIQVVQTKRNELLIKAVIDGEERDTTIGIRREIDNMLRVRRLETVVSFEIQPVKEIKNNPKTGKQQVVVPLGPQ